MGVTAGLDRFQRRHTWLGFPVAVVYKFIDDQGGYLASLITYYGFLSLFPLMLLLVSVLGYTLEGDPAVQHALLGSALQHFPIIGPQLQQNISSIHGSRLGVIVGILGALYGGLGVTLAIQNAPSIESGRYRVMPAPTWWCPGSAAWCCSSCSGRSF
jgi:membrane protein